MACCAPGMRESHRSRGFGRVAARGATRGLWEKEDEGRPRASSERSREAALPPGAGAGQLKSVSNKETFSKPLPSEAPSRRRFLRTFRSRHDELALLTVAGSRAVEILCAAAAGEATRQPGKERVVRCTDQKQEGQIPRASSVICVTRRLCRGREKMAPRWYELGSRRAPGRRGRCFRRSRLREKGRGEERGEDAGKEARRRRQSAAASAVSAAGQRGGRRSSSSSNGAAASRTTWTHEADLERSHRA